MITRFCQRTIMLFLVCFSCAWAQIIAPPINPEPLARPKYLTSIQSKNAVQVLKAISDSLTQNGFAIAQYDSKECQLEATRSDSSVSKGQDKVIVWLERDIQDPENYIRVYLMYGHFVEILAGRSGVYRIVISAADEEKRIGKLRQSLVSISLNR